MTDERDLIGRATGGGPLGVRTRSTVGFVSDEVFAERIAACLRCEFHADAAVDDRTLIGCAAIGSSGYCRRSGWTIDEKARLTLAVCPEPSLDDHRRSRWGEPR